MAATSQRDDPYTAFNFIVDIQGMRAGFSEVGGLTTENDVVEYREGNGQLHMTKLPGLSKYTAVSLKRGFTDDKGFWKWRLLVIQGKTQRLSGTITLLNEARQPALVWRFFEGWPSKWSGPALNAKNNEVAIEEIEITCERVEMES